MKKGVLVSGIIWIIMSAIALLIFVIMAGVSYFGLSDSQVLADSARAAGTTVEAAKEALTLTATMFTCAAIEMVLTIVFSIVLIAKRNSNMGKGAGIALGIVSIVFGSVLPGIFFIVDSAKTRS